MRAGVGWEEGWIGTASVGADLASPSGFALRTSKPGYLGGAIEHFL
jgi:hypothetical protein